MTQKKESMSSNAPISFRMAVESDVDFLRALRFTTMREVVLKHQPWDDEEQEQRLMVHFDAIRIIIKDGCEIGMLKIVQEGDHVHLVQVQLLPAFQGRGIGTWLITDLQEKYGSLGLPITLRAYVSNRAIALYSRLGFQVIERSERSCTMRWHQRETEPNQSPQLTRPTGG